MSESGVCSYYGAECNGNLTASGEQFNMWAMTAAHKSLPFGTMVRVTNKDNGKTIDVKINDRGPFVEGRILDLSQGAFQQVENTGRGLFNCSIQRL